MGNVIKLRNLMFYQLRETWCFSGFVASFSSPQSLQDSKKHKANPYLTALDYVVKNENNG